MPGGGAVLVEHIPDLPAGVVVLNFPLHPVKFLKQAENRHVRILMSDFDPKPTTRRKVELGFGCISLNC
jgi:hypothetical protein